MDTLATPAGDKENGHCYEQQNGFGKDDHENQMEEEVTGMIRAKDDSFNHNRLDTRVPDTSSFQPTRDKGQDGGTVGADYQVHFTSNGEGLNVIQKLLQLENDLKTTKTELTSVKETLTATEMVMDNLLQRLDQTESKLKDEMTVMQKELDVYKQEVKMNQAQFTKKLDEAESEIESTKQQLTSANQSLTKAEKQYSMLVASTDEAMVKLETRIMKMLSDAEKLSDKKIAGLSDQIQERSKEVESGLYWVIRLNTEAIKSSLHTQVTPVLFKMTDYSTKKEKRVDWYSDPFYTHSKGYKMCLNVFSAGLNSPYLTMWLHLVKGSYDDHLKWPVKGQLEVKLVNQVSNCEHYSEVGDIDSGSKQPIPHKKQYVWYNYEFISHESLQAVSKSCQYLKDDSLFFQVQFKLDGT